MILAEGEVVADGPTTRRRDVLADVRPAGRQDPVARGVADRRPGRGAPSPATSRRGGRMTLTSPTRRAARGPSAWAARRWRPSRSSRPSGSSPSPGRCWPRPESAAVAHATDAPARCSPLVVPLLLLVVLAQVNDGGMDAKSIAMLGVLAAVICGTATARRRHRRPRADLGRPHPRRPRPRAGLRLLPRRHLAVRVRPAHRRRRPVAAVPDARAPPGSGSARACCRARQRPSRAAHARRLRRRRLPRLRLPAEPVVLAVHRRAARAARLQRRAPRSARTCWPGCASAWSRPSATTSRAPSSTVVLILVAGRPVLLALRRMSRKAAFDAPVAFEPGRDSRA